ncbi:MAG: AMP-binding protein, partial [Halieaceae bacterium]|nr:AMP-binding protein [Halieaceae bacterium]
DWDEFVAGGSPQVLEKAHQSLEDLSADDVSDIIFTSGTTGDPKGVITCHGQNVQTYRQWAQAVGLRSSDRYLILWPFFHCSGYKSGWLASFIAGATIYPEPVLDIPRLRRTVEAEGITVMPGPPNLFQTLLADTEQESKKLPVRLAITGASSVPPSLIEAMRNELGIESVLAGYGLTETCGTVTMTDMNDSPQVIVRSCGRAIDGVEVRCVDQMNNEVARGEAGEVVVRGFNVMRGYLDEDEQSGVIDARGWLHTGDLAVMDDSGYLTITDRIKDVYIYGGFNCYPAEIEKIMLTHPNIFQVAVIGVADEQHGEVGKAFVVLKPDKQSTAEQITTWCRDAMANYKVPRYLEIIDTLPLNATGKVQKFKLR